MVLEKIYENKFKKKLIIDLITYFPKLKKYIYNNPNLSYDLMLSLKILPEISDIKSWNNISINTDFCLDILKKNIPWNYQLLTINDKIPFEFIVNNEFLNWNWLSLLKQKKINETYIENIIIEFNNFKKFCINNCQEFGVKILQLIINKNIVNNIVLYKILLSEYKLKSKSFISIEIFLINFEIKIFDKLSQNPNINFTNINKFLSYNNIWNYDKLLYSILKNNYSLVNFSNNLKKIKSINNDALLDPSFNWLKDLDINIHQFIINYYNQQKYEFTFNNYYTIEKTIYLLNTKLIDGFLINKSMSEELIIKFPEKNINYDMLSQNESISLKYIFSNLNKSWNFNKISSRNDLSFLLVKNNINLNWNWENLSKNISIDTILNNLNYNWIWEEVSSNPSLNLNIVVNYFNLSWNYLKIVQNNYKVICEKFVYEKIVSYSKYILYKNNYPDDLVKLILSFI